MFERGKVGGRNSETTHGVQSATVMQVILVSHSPLSLQSYFFKKESTEVILQKAERDCLHAGVEVLK